MYKLMLSDLDETLLIDHHVPDFNVEAIKWFEVYPCNRKGI